MITLKKENVRFIGNNPRKDFKNSTIRECLNYLSGLKEVSLDIETTRKYNKYGDLEGLDPYTSRIVMLQIGDKHRQYVIDARYIGIKIFIEAIKDKLIIGTNLKFEYKHILHATGIRLEYLYDIMINDQILYRGYNYPSNFESQVFRYLDIELPETSAKSFLSIGDREFTPTQILYGAGDIFYPLYIKDYQDVYIDSKELRKEVELESLFIPVLGDMEYNGMYLNKEEWIKVADKNKKLFNKYKDTLDTFVINHVKDDRFVSRQYDLFSTGDPTKCIVKWSSPKQTIDLFKYLTICPINSQNGKYTVNADALKAFIPEIVDYTNTELIDFINTYLKYKEYEKASSTYGEDFFKYIHPITGRLHSNYRQILNTGRISSSNPIKLGVISVMI